VEEKEKREGRAIRNAYRLPGKLRGGEGTVEMTQRKRKKGRREGKKKPFGLGFQRRGEKENDLNNPCHWRRGKGKKA